MGGFDRGTVAEIDADALRANFAEAGRRAEGRTLFAVVKADAYGHGAVGVARALVGAGCERLAVVSVDEGIELREAGIELPILVLGGVGTASEQAVAGRLTPVVHHTGQRKSLSAAARGAGVQVPVQVEVDTGMRRMGVAPGTAVGLLAEVAEDSNLELEGVFTHLARADEPDLGPSLEQLAEFGRVLAAAHSRGIAPRWVHFGNSAAILCGKRLLEALPEANAARPGLMLYGVCPAEHLAADLLPVMTLRTRVVQVLEIGAGESVGYSALFRAEHATRVATLAIGYADGVPVAASNRGQVLIAGRRHPIVGRVSMDYISVDVGEAPVGIGDEAIILGEGLRAEEAASASGTIPYELLVRVGRRVPRVERS